VSLFHYLILSSLLFSLGVFGVMARKSLIGILISLELILNSANLNLLALARFGVLPSLISQVSVLVIIALAAAEAAVGLALALSLFRAFKSNDINLFSSLRG